MEDLKDMAEWLRDMEHRAASVYSKAAIYFKDDHPVSKFLNDMASDEIIHTRLMSTATEILSMEKDRQTYLLLDAYTKGQLSAPLAEFEKDLRTNTVTKEKLLDALVQIESSEWNDLFVYVLNSLKERGLSFRDIAPQIQQHTKKLEYFLESIPEGHAYLPALQRIPVLWKERILIVEDDETLREFYEQLLSREGEVETAKNGREALEKAQANYFKVILSDVSMPIMNGMQFFEKLQAQFPSVRSRFIFMSALPSPELTAFLKKHQLRFLSKPMTIQDVKKAVHEVMLAEGAAKA